MFLEGKPSDRQAHFVIQSYLGLALSVPMRMGSRGYYFTTPFVFLLNHKPPPSSKLASYFGSTPGPLKG